MDLTQLSLVVAVERLEKALEGLRTVQLTQVPFESYKAVFNARMDIAQAVGLLKSSVE